MQLILENMNSPLNKLKIVFNNIFTRIEWPANPFLEAHVGVLIRVIFTVIGAITGPFLYNAAPTLYTLELMILTAVAASLILPPKTFCCPIASIISQHTVSCKPKPVSKHCILWSQQHLQPSSFSS